MDKSVNGNDFFRVKPEIIDEIRKQKGKSNRGRKISTGATYWLYQFKSSRQWLERLGKTTEPSYNTHLRLYCFYHKKTPDDLIRIAINDMKNNFQSYTQEQIAASTTMPRSRTQEMVEEYVLHLIKIGSPTSGKPKKGIFSNNSIDDYTDGIKSYYKFSNIPVNWHNIKFPQQRPTTYRAFSDEEYKILLGNCKNDRERCMVALQGAAGVRVGVAANNVTGCGAATLAEFYPLIPDKKGNLLEIGEIEDSGCAVLMCYPESNTYIYPTFLIPELRKYVNDYLKFRRNTGEKLKLDSPLTREHFKDGSPNTNFPRHVSTSDVNHTIHIIAKRGAKTVDLTNIPPDHGLRKRFSNCIERCSLKDTVAAMLMGHMNMQIKHYNDHDYRIPEHRQKNLPYVISEFKKAIDELTIGENYKLKERIEILNEKVAEQPKMDEMKELVDRYKIKVDLLELQKERDREQMEENKNVLAELKNMLGVVAQSGATIPVNNNGSVTEQMVEHVKAEYYDLTNDNLTPEEIRNAIHKADTSNLAKIPMNNFRLVDKTDYALWQKHKEQVAAKMKIPVKDLREVWIGGVKPPEIKK